MMRNPARSLRVDGRSDPGDPVDRGPDQGWELVRVSVRETEVIGSPSAGVLVGHVASGLLAGSGKCWILSWRLSERQSRHSTAMTSTGSAMPFRCAVRRSVTATSGTSASVSALARISPAPASALILAAVWTPRPV